MDADAADPKGTGGGSSGRTPPRADELAWPEPGGLYAGCGAGAGALAACVPPWARAMRATDSPMDRPGGAWVLDRGAAATEPVLAPTDGARPGSGLGAEAAVTELALTFTTGARIGLAETGRGGGKGVAGSCSIDAAWIGGRGGAAGMTFATEIAECAGIGGATGAGGCGSASAACTEGSSSAGA